MNVFHETFESGWLGVYVALTREEAAALIDRLHRLIDGRIDHFHFGRDDFASDAGVADIEFSLRGETEPDNMIIG
ncbi:MAG TPA: hypothetical protein PKC18_13585 [Lacipirellulaceae bacterium]|nr:hypothetical protein [Lacipirellulaceae bacterium]